MKYVNFKYGNEKLEIGKLVCVGRNYAAHAAELGNEIPEFPIIFLKPSSALIYSGGKIIHPDYSNELHHEAELVLLIGETVKNAGSQEAENAIIGYGVGLDMTLRDLQNELKAKGQPWTLSKCFDTSAVVSDFISKNEYKLTCSEPIKLWVNKELRQNSPLNKMIFSPVEIVKYISSKMTLEKGDLIFTGTPEGVSKVNRGDKIEAEITNIARLSADIF